MTAPEAGEKAFCRHCGRPLNAPTSIALHLGPVCFRYLVGHAGRPVTAICEGQLVLDLDMSELLPELERATQ